METLESNDLLPSRFELNEGSFENFHDFWKNQSLVRKLTYLFVFVTRLNQKYLLV